MKAIITILCIAIPMLTAAESSTEDLNELMFKWLNLESQKGKLQTEWSAQQIQIEKKINLFEAEKQSLQKLLEDFQNNTNEVDLRRHELIQKQQRLEDERTVLREKMLNAESFIRDLMAKLPPPLQNQWAKKMQLIIRADISDSDKLDGIVQLLKLTDDFDRRVAIHKTIMEFVNENHEIEKIQATQIYLGLGHGWYVSEDGSAYGYGKSTADGWVWWNKSESQSMLGNLLDAEQLLEIKSMIESPTNASFISIPIKIN
jgi:hypothetical protein